MAANQLRYQLSTKGLFHLGDKTSDERDLLIKLTEKLNFEAFYKRPKALSLQPRLVLVVNSRYWTIRIMYTKYLLDIVVFSYYTADIYVAFY